MIKILMVLENTGRGGSQTYVMNVIRNIDRSRFKIDVAVSRIIPNGYQDEMKELGCEIHILPYFKIYNLIKYAKIWDVFLSSHHYEIVHGHCTNSAGIYLRIAKRHNCKTIAHSHSAGFRGNRIERLVKTAFSKLTKSTADLWFACSDLAAERLYGKNFKESKKYHTLPNAICVYKYKFNKDIRNKIRTLQGISNDTRVFGHVGSFSTPKNHEFLIDIFYNIKKSIPESLLLLCGDGPLMTIIKNKIRVLNLDDSVILAGNVPNVEEYMMAMDTMIFPSIFEGLPVSVVEAQSTGLPVLHSDIITNEVDLTDIVKVLPLNESSQKWAEEAINMINDSRAEQNEIIAKTPFNMNESIKKLEALYSSMFE